MHDGPLEVQPGGIAWDQTLRLTAPDGVRLRGALWQGGERGLVLLLAGRTEFLEKYTQPAAQLVQRGFTVAGLDWRGQGLSQRLIHPHVKGHVGHFTEFHRDLDALLAHPAVSELPGPRIMLANSMGGAIGLGALYRGRAEVDAAVLLAPMLGIRMGALLRFFSHLVLPVARRTGNLTRWPPLPRMARPYAFEGFDGNVLTGDREMFDWFAQTIQHHRDLQLAMPTLGWVSEALAEMGWLRAQGRLSCPCLCLLGGLETVVTPAAVRSGADLIGARLAEIAGARHDLLMEAEPLRAQVWEQIDRFLGTHGI
ncbi:MAG TPA: alpha/beta hydrolase [Thermohalobaculum sp.]|nr:alpha/beta hydrolase [Thermohalobaculum sp.]